MTALAGTLKENSTLTELAYVRPERGGLRCALTRSMPSIVTALAAMISFQKVWRHCGML